MVNLIMRVTGDETLTMSRSFLMKKYNYSHCPLKKRPVQFIKEERKYDDKDASDDYSEPENLSTKPEDLSRSCKTRTPPPAIALISVKKEKDVDGEEVGWSAARSPAAERAFARYQSKSSGPLEPLNLNTAPVHSHEPPANPQWPRAVPAHYPPHYIPLNYIYPPPPPPQHDALPYHYPAAVAPCSSPPRIPAVDAAAAAAPPYAGHDPCASPPRHAFTPFRWHVPVIAALPRCNSAESRLYHAAAAAAAQPGEHSPLSPTSTTSSGSYPYYLEPSSSSSSSSPPSPLSPQDLSSPGSVGSLCGDSSGSSVAGGAANAGASSSKKKCKDSPHRYKCSYCAKSYSTYSGLSKHQQFHCSANEEAAAKKKFKCKYCDKEYNSLGALKMHIRTHTLPCKCTQCGKAFSRPWLLQGHIRTHTGEKPFSCPHCNRAFADRSNLRAHLQTHSDVKKYSCPTCSKTFSRMSLLSKHADGGCPGVPAGVIRVTDDVNSFYLDN